MHHFRIYKALSFKLQCHKASKEKLLFPFYRWENSAHSLINESRGSEQKPGSYRKCSVCVCYLLSRVWLFRIPYVAHQAPLSTGFPSQEYWSGLAFPSLGDLPDPGIKPRSPTLQAYSLTSEPPGKCRASFKVHSWMYMLLKVCFGVHPGTSNRP